ncbi:MAG: AAA family ATPase [Enhydrobacter sp.]|nr:AAA family ATPase [Enhydrobacter sp.]
MATLPSAPKDITGWLHGLGLGKYHDTFLANDVDLRALPHLTDTDLRELGVSLGHRRIMLAAITALSAAPVPATRPLSGVAQGPADTDHGERRLVSVMFCDMVGSTELSRRLDAEDMRQLLKTYQECVAGAVAAWGGHLAQYLGDGVMAYFGWPTAYEDQAERAVRAGLEALAAVKSLEADAAGPISSRIAIATGEVVIGDLSSDGRREGRIAGETPNFAARLQQCADGGQLVISEATRNLIGSAFDIADCGRRVVKGFEGGVRVYRVDGVRNAESRFDATRGQSLSRFVGRTSELGLVMDKWELAKSGEGQVVLVSGDAGIGKSRFVRAVTDALGRDAHVRWLQCSPYHMTSALFPVIQTLNRLLDFRTEDDFGRRRDKLRDYLGATADEAAVSVLAGLLSIEPAEEGLPSMSPQERKLLALSTLVERVVGLANNTPLLLVVEDAHWIDPTTLELVEQIVARIATARVLLLVLHRPEWGADWSGRWGHVTGFSLGRLSRPQVDELVRDLMGADASDELVGEIAVRTDGVPMFVEEVARSLVEAGPEKSVGSLLVPATLQGALVARLDALAAASRDVVQAAAVMGREFHPEVVARVCEVPREEIDAALDELSRARIVTRGGGEGQIVSFRHALIQDVAYQSLLRSRRRQLHQSAADALLELRPETAATQPELVAHHLTEAGLPDRALALWHSAGERALARYANDEAVRHFEKGVEAARQLCEAEGGATVLQSLIRLGHAQRAASRLPLAMATFHNVFDLARANGDIETLVEAALGYDQTEFNVSDTHKSSAALLQEALTRTGETPDTPMRCRLMVALTRAYIMSGEHEAAERQGRHAAAMARRLGDSKALVEVLIHEVLVPKPGYEPAQLPELESQLDELLAVASSNDEDFDLHSRALATCFYRWTEIGQRDRMDRILGRWLAWAETRNNAVVKWISCHAQSLVATMEGDLAAAESLAEQAVELGRHSQGGQAEGVYGMQMFTIRREQSRLAEVAPFVKRLLDDERTRAVWQPGFALIASELGYHDVARRMLAELAEDGFAFPHDAKLSATLGYLAEVCAAVSDPASASKLYSLLKPYANMTITAGVATMCYGSAQRHLALLAEVIQDWEAAEEHYEAALVANRCLGASLWLAHTQADFGRMLLRRGRSAESGRAEALQEAAWSTASTLGLSALTGKLRQTQN